MRGPHDVGGLPAGPVDTSPHNPDFWEKQIDAMSQLCRKQGVMKVDESRYYIERMGHDVYDRLTYYERWAAALMLALIDKGVLTQDEIDARVKAVKQRLQETGELEPGSAAEKC